ncbi:MAG: helix-turn-helix transcriptional regulator [Sphingomonas fennica]
MLVCADSALSHRHCVHRHRKHLAISISHMVNQQLRYLRECARPRLTVRAIAELLNISPSAYHAYESERRFKQRYLPMGLTLRLARILGDHGVNPDEVMLLAGVGADALTKPALSAAEEQLVAAYRALQPDTRLLLLRLAKRLANPAEPETAINPAEPNPA